MTTIIPPFEDRDYAMLTRIFTQFCSDMAAMQNTDFDNDILATQQLIKKINRNHKAAEPFNNRVYPAAENVKMLGFYMGLFADAYYGYHNKRGKYDAEIAFAENFSRRLYRFSRELGAG